MISQSAQEKQGQHLPQNSVPIHRAIHGCDACSCGFLGGIGDIDTNALIDGTRFSFANDDLFYLAILAKVIISSKCLQESIFIFDRWHQTNHIDKILLLDADAS